MMAVNAPSFVTIDGRKMAYDEVCPPNPRGTVLLLTGLAAKRLGWKRQLDEFGQTYRTIAIDHRDIGDSDPYTAPYSTADQADDAAAVLRALAIPHAAVVGISMGGFIALELTLRHPEMVEKLVLTSTSAGGRVHKRASLGLILTALMPWSRRGEPGARALRTYTRIMGPGYARSHPQEMAAIAAGSRYRPQSAASYQRQLDACNKHDVVDRLARIHVPTLVIHGDHDPLVPVQNGRYLAAHIPGARMIEYQRVGHIPIIERATEYNRDVLAFLAE